MRSSLNTSGASCRAGNNIVYLLIVVSSVVACGYRWAFNQIFDNNAARSSASTDIYNYPQSMIATQVPAAARLIVLEEDIEIAPDFFSYFGAMVCVYMWSQSRMSLSAAP